MSVESTKANTDQNWKPSILESLQGGLKTKIFNKIYFYVLVSFLVLNWQEVIILFKSKDDIYYTLSVIFTGQHLSIPFTKGFFLSPWFAHFWFPLFVGLFASVLAPFITYATSKLTTKWFAKMRREDGLADLEVEKEYQELRAEIAKKTKNSNNLENINLIMQKENELLESKNKSLKEYRVELFYGIKAFVDCYDERKGLNTDKDVIEFLRAVEHTEFYKDQSINRKIPKLIGDIKTFTRKAIPHQSRETMKMVFSKLHSPF